VGRVTSRNTAARVIRGAISLSSSSHFPLVLNSNSVNPVALPPGRARLSTKPALRNARVPQAIGQSFDWLVPAEAEVLVAQVKVTRAVRDAVGPEADILIEVPLAEFEPYWFEEPCQSNAQPRSRGCPAGSRAISR
jgi:hypothetical protein